MSDTTDSTEQMHMTSEADGRDQFVNDGGVATLLIHEGTEMENMLDNDGALPDPGNSANPVIMYVLQWLKDSISLVADKCTRISDHKKKTMSNAIDGNIGYFANEIYMTGMKSSDDTKVDNIRPQVGRFVYLVDPDVKVLSSSRLLTGNITTLDHTRSNGNDGKIRYHDNEIDMVDLVCLRGRGASSFLMVQADLSQIFPPLSSSHLST